MRSRRPTHFLAAAVLLVACVPEESPLYPPPPPVSSSLAIGAVAPSASAAGAPVSFAPAVALAAGSGTTCALLADGEVACWGVGVGVTPVAMPALKGAKQLAMHTAHSFAILGDGAVLAWGRNDHGELGDGTKENQKVPVAVPQLKGAQQIAPGGGHTCALDAGGAVRCWGFDGMGELGDGESSETEKIRVPERPILRDVKSIDAGTYFACALAAKDGSVRCWGAGTNGQTGTDEMVTQSPRLIKGLHDVKQLVLGGVHACALLGDGTVKCWGANSDGQIGNGATKEDAHAPTKVVSLGGVQKLALGETHSCATLGDGTVRCWGSNHQGQLGTGDTVSKSTPVEVKGLKDVTALSLGKNHSCAIVRDGAVWCWGDNNLGELGDGTTDDRYAPTRVKWSPGAPVAP